MENLIVYVHGKNGTADEALHYKPLFPSYDVIGIDYKTSTPWECGAEIRNQLTSLRTRYKRIVLIGNSIGAFFSMSAGLDNLVSEAFFISPVVNMEMLIRKMMTFAGVSEAELEEKKIIHTSFGEDLSFEYYSYVKSHPLSISIPIHILYGSNDNIISSDMIDDFVQRHHAFLTVMDNGEHWFHTEEQQEFLDKWLLSELV